MENRPHEIIINLKETTALSTGTCCSYRSQVHVILFISQQWEYCTTCTIIKRHETDDHQTRRGRSVGIWAGWLSKLTQWSYSGFLTLTIALICGMFMHHSPLGNTLIACRGAQSTQGFTYQGMHWYRWRHVGLFGYWWWHRCQTRTHPAPVARTWTALRWHHRWGAEILPLHSPAKRR